MMAPRKTNADAKAPSGRLPASLAANSAAKMITELKPPSAPLAREDAGWSAG